MSNLKSLTGRTVVESSVAETGDVSVAVRRNGMTVTSFSLPREEDIPKTAKIRLEKGVVVVTVDNKDVDRIPVV